MAIGPLFKPAPISYTENDTGPSNKPVALNGQPTFPQLSASTEEILKRARAAQAARGSTAPGWEAMRQEVLSNMITSDKLVMTPKAKYQSARNRGRGRGKTVPASALSQSITPNQVLSAGAVATVANPSDGSSYAFVKEDPSSGRGSGRGKARGRGQGRGRGRGNGRGGKRKRDDSEDEKGELSEVRTTSRCIASVYNGLTMLDKGRFGILSRTYSNSNRNKIWSQNKQTCSVCSNITITKRQYQTTEINSQSALYLKCLQNMPAWRDSTEQPDSLL
jgi:hypothetical protein